MWMQEKCFKWIPNQFGQTDLNLGLNFILNWFEWIKRHVIMNTLATWVWFICVQFYFVHISRYIHNTYVRSNSSTANFDFRKFYRFCKLVLEVFNFVNILYKIWIVVPSQPAHNSQFTLEILWIFGHDVDLTMYKH